MTWDEAITFCEEHECDECFVYLENKDKRTEQDRQNHIPCVENLVDTRFGGRYSAR